jgi:hypothetical protein
LESPGFCFVLRQVPSDEVVRNGSVQDGISRMWKTLATKGSAAPGSVDVPALSGWPAAGAELETAAPESFVEPAALGWPAASFSSEAAAPESGNGA